MGVERIRLDGVLVIGAGLAGLSAALAAAPRHVLVISPATLSQAWSSAWAQGGVAVAGDHRGERGDLVGQGARR